MTFRTIEFWNEPFVGEHFGLMTFIKPQQRKALGGHCAARGKVWFWHAALRWGEIERMAAIAQAEPQAVGSAPIRP